MSRLLTNCLTIVTLIASLLQVQCLAFCSVRAAAATSGHACCPLSGEQKTGGENSRSPQKPCSPNPASFDEARAESSHGVESTAFSVTMLHLPAPFDLWARATSVPLAAAKPVRPFGSLSILRI